MTALSVIICTHNPRPDYFARVIDALSAQSLPATDWELLIVDNASADSVADTWPCRSIPSVRHIREDELGLTPARLRGISEAEGDVLVFVDDDNVLAPDYLENAVAIGRDWPALGAWGGAIRGEFEVAPQKWMEPLLEYLAIREFDRLTWSNNPDDWRALPCGAGMCVRAVVARAYARRVEADPVRRKLGRVGSALWSGEDLDLAQTSCDLDLGFGTFPQLTMTHLIPAARVRADYFLRLIHGIVASGVLLRYLRSGDLRKEPNALKVWLRYLAIYVRGDRDRAKVYKVSQDAIRTGVRAARGLASSREGSRASA